jgi:hypothetical protein
MKRYRPALLSPFGKSMIALLAVAVISLYGLTP